MSEIGRQPWIVNGLMKTASAVSPNVSAGFIFFSLVSFSLVYTLLGIAMVYLFLKVIKQGPLEKQKETSMRQILSVQGVFHMQLSEIWFILIGVLFIGFMFLEGFDFGVGMSTRFLARNDIEKRVLINSIGPFWDANEVWLITAGGAMFAAFPHWYATLFSGYYLPFVVLLLALIARGVAFEFRGKLASAKWIKTWDWSIFLGSLLPPFLVGVLFISLIKGVPIDSEMNMYAGLLRYCEFIQCNRWSSGYLLMLFAWINVYSIEDRW